MAALGGGLGAEFLGLDPQYPLKYLVMFLIVVAVGGLGRITGVFYASLIIGVLDFALKKYLPQGGTVFIYAHDHPAAAVAAAGPVRTAGMSALPVRPATIRRRARSPNAIGLRWWEPLPWLLALAFYFAFPRYLGFGTELLITILFAISLDLALGYAGIVTLGHAAFFGAGAYTVGMLAKHEIWTEPISGLVIAAVVAGAVGFALRPGAAAHHRADAADAHALHHGAAGGDRQHGRRRHRRLRRPRQPADQAGVRHVRVRCALFQHAVSLRARRAVRLLSCSCARWSIRRSARA